MSVTLETAVQGVITAVQAAGLTRGDGTALNVTDSDPLPGTLDRPCSVSVTFGVMTATDFGVTVRLYADGSNDIPQAEKLTRSLTPALDAALDPLDTPRTPWAKSWSPELTAYVVETTVLIGREDF